VSACVCVCVRVCVCVYTHRQTQTKTQTQTQTRCRHRHKHTHTREINTNIFTVNVGLCHNSRARIRRVHRQRMRADLAVPHAVHAVIRTAETRGSPNEYKEVSFRRRLGTIKLVLNSDTSDRKGQRRSSGSVDAADAQERHGRRRRGPKIYRNAGRRVRAVAEAVTDFV